MQKMTFALAALAAVAGVGEAAAQGRIPLSVEVRADAAFPQGEFGDATETAVGFGVNAALRLVPNVGIYGGYSRTSFELEGFLAEAVDQGFSVGLTFGLPSLGGVATPWVGAGLLIHEFELDADDDAGDIEADSDLGFEVGAGLAIPLARNIRLTPGVGFRQYGAEIPGLLGGQFDVSYLTAGVGLNISF